MRDVGAIQGYDSGRGDGFCSAMAASLDGNDPERLASFYTDDAFYSDPAVPDGVEGKPALLRYFRALLARFPDWEWSNVDAIPLEGGFLNVWRVRIPNVSDALEGEGVCTVQLRDGLIERNRVYFDRIELLAGIADVASSARHVPPG